VLTEADLQSIRATAHAMADVARDATLSYFRRSDLTADNKEAGGFDPVTAADRASERAMREVLAARRPEDGIEGEEEAAKAGSSGLTWVIDPIDGTRSFVAGAPTWGVLIALFDGTRPVLGMIDQPYIGERFYGETTGDAPVAWMRRGDRQTPLAVRGGRRIAEATLVSTFPEIGTLDERTAFERVKDRAQLTRYGMDCYGYALLASGQVDLVVEAGLQIYDVQALIPVVEAAGGVITNWTGGPCHQGGQVIAAGDAAIHREALALLAGG
jgi:histidinol phosphatase-like enzyme (inositol monophosphatase family)